MARRAFRKLAAEVELDLAPLLAVMVKLVPVLLMSSAFVQLSVIETDLPQVVKESIEQSKENPTAQLKLYLRGNGDAELVFSKGTEQESFKIAAVAEAQPNVNGIADQLMRLKAKEVSLFSLELMPDKDVQYSKVVQVMDAARKSPDKNVKFKVTDRKTGAIQDTDFMYPDVVFSNLFTEG
jgi:biopolymer transport protein ExbD